MSSSISSIRIGRAQDLHGRPRPERGFFFVGEVAFLPGGHLGDVDTAGRPGPAPLELLSRDGEQVAGGDIPGGGEQVSGGLALLLDSSHEGGQQRELGPGPLVHPGLDPGPGFLGRAFGCLDRARGHPARPPGGIVGGPAGDVLIEGFDEDQLAAEVDPRPDRPAVGVADEGQPFLPCPGDLGRQVERVDAGMVDLQVPPEQPAQGAGDRPQRGVVEVGSPLGEVLHH
ncbi:MAG TPA: hypothetical protein VEH31_35290, partial [Streptosporangiaceae bacterium]|nr:hypothetical protein [Streptosporangiaceae bacterium]